MQNTKSHSMKTRRATKTKRKDFNFKDFNENGWNSSDELDYVDVDLHGERELLGSDVDEDTQATQEMDEEELEEGQISDDGDEDSDEMENEMDPKILELAKKGEVDSLKRILKKQQEECCKLKREVDREKEKERLRTKEVRELLTRIKQTSQAKSNLQHSLASSRANTPEHSPCKTSKNRADVRKVITKKTTAKTAKATKKEKTREEKSEYDDTLKTLLNLKQGNCTDYAQLVMNAIDATDNIMSLKTKENVKSTEISSTNMDNTCNSKVVKGRENEGQVETGGKGANALPLLDILEQFQNKGAQSKEDNDIDKQILTMQIALLNRLKQKKNGKDDSEQVLNVIEDNGTSDSVTNLETTNKECDKKKKLTSGKCAKPDEATSKYQSNIHTRNWTPDTHPKGTLTSYLSTC